MGEVTGEAVPKTPHFHSAAGSHRRKLIEVALPLEAINREAVREKAIRHGHPSTMHVWFARRPLAACRAVLFAQLVDDPSAHPETFPTDQAQDIERQRLLRIVERLVPWEAAVEESVLEEARTEIRKSCGGDLPTILDPFCGGGSIPLEVQRLGLRAEGSDLNPVATLITKSLVEIPSRFVGLAPVNPNDRPAQFDGSWRGAEGIARDVRYYGQWMHREAHRRLEYLYPGARLPSGEETTVVAWLWARTVVCPNPACRRTMPLVRSFWLGKKRDRPVWIRPVVHDGTVDFEIIQDASGPSIEATVTRAGARCLGWCPRLGVNGRTLVRTHGQVRRRL
jgi:putative DNA methylase